MPDQIISITNLYKSYGKKSILEDINLSIDKGERVAVLGANGAGKTTLVNMISLNTSPTSGNINVNIDKDVKKEIGIQYQEGNWPSGINADDMLRFFKQALPNFSVEREKMLNDVFEIEAFRKTPLNRLSGGQKQRFNAMLSVLNKPQIVILDELTTGLDMKLQFKIIEFFRKSTVEDKQTLLIVSHSPEEVEKLCTRMIIVGNKTIMFDKQLDDIRKKNLTVRQIMDTYFEKGNVDEYK